MLENNEEIFIFDSMVGLLEVQLQSGKLVGLSYIKSKQRNKFPHLPLSPAARKIRQQIQAYFKNAHTKLSVPIKFNRGTDFQQRVWREMLKIKPGKTLSYGELALIIGSGPRAVANACRANPIPVVVPCHRIVAKSGIGGYHGKTSGQFINIKQTLLNHEGWQLDA